MPETNINKEIAVCNENIDGEKMPKTEDGADIAIWKLTNLYNSGVASSVVIFSVFIDICSLINPILTNIMTGVAIVVTFALLAVIKNKCMEMMDRVRNKQLLSEIFGVWSTFGVFIFIIEKFLPFVIKDVYSIFIIVLFIALLVGGVIITVNKTKKEEWKEKVDL